MVRENGVTYNVYDESAGQATALAARHRAFHPRRDDWAVMKQRLCSGARLTDAILAMSMARKGLVAEAICHHT